MLITCILSLGFVSNVTFSADTAASTTAATTSDAIEWYYYDDFKTGYESDSEPLKGLEHSYPASFEKVKRFLDAEGNGMVRVLPYSTKEGTQFSKWINQVPGKPKLVLEFKMKAFLDSAGSNFAWDSNNGDSTFILKRGTDNGFYDKAGGTKMRGFSIDDRNNWYTVTIVYDNENLTRTIYINGEEMGTFEGNDYASTGNFKFNVSVAMNESSYVDFDYIKVYKYTGSFNPKNTSLTPYDSESKSDVKVDVSKYKRYIDMLSGLGFVKSSAFKETDKITREDFAVLLAKMLNLNITSGQVSGIYTDVTAKEDKTYAIESLYRLKIMTGKDGTQFKPKDNITAQEALASLIKALGYDEQAKIKGGYPSGYYTVAKELGVLKNAKIVLSEEISKGELAVLSRNFLGCNILDVVSVSDSGYTSQTKAGETVLSIHHGIDFVEDIVSGNVYTMLDKPVGLSEGYYKLGNLLLNSAKIDLTNAFGKSAIVYYVRDTGEIKYYELSDEKNNVLKITKSEFSDYANGEITYEKEDKSYTKKIPTDAYVIYNKKAVKEFTSELFNITSGYIELIDNDNDNTYEVVMIYNYENVVVDKISFSDNLIMLKNKPSIDLDQFTDYGIFGESNNPIGLDTLKEWYVLSLMYDLDRDSLFIYRSSNKKTSTVREVSISATEGYVVFEDDKKVTLSEDFLTNYPYVQSGTSGDFYLNFLGDLVAHNEIAGTDTGLAYFINGKQTNQMSDDIVIKMFTEKNMMTTVQTKTKVILDGSSIKALAALEQLSSNGSFIPQLVRYQINKEGYLTEIDTTQKGSSESTENMLTKLYDSNGTALEYYIDGKNFAGEVFMTTDCKVFCVPPDLSTATNDDFSVKDLSVLKSSESYIFTAYTYSENEIGAKVLVVKASATASYGKYDLANVIDSVTKVVTDKGEVVHKVTYYNNKNKKEAYTKEEKTFEGRHSGDIMLLAFDIEGKIFDYKLLYDAKKRVLANETDKASRRLTLQRNQLGWVYQVKSGVFQYARVNPNTGNDFANLSIETHRVPKNIYIYDAVRNKVSLGSEGDLISYKSSSTGYSQVFIWETYCVDYDMVIMKYE